MRMTLDEINDCIVCADGASLPSSSQKSNFKELTGSTNSYRGREGGGGYLHREPFTKTDGAGYLDSFNKTECALFCQYMTVIYYHVPGGGYFL